MSEEKTEVVMMSVEDLGSASKPGAVQPTESPTTPVVEEHTPHSARSWRKASKMAYASTRSKKVEQELHLFKYWRKPIITPFTKGGFSATDDLRSRILHVIHHEKMHLFLTLLLCIDVALVFSGMGLETEALYLEINSCEDMIDVCMAETQVLHVVPTVDHTEVTTIDDHGHTPTVDDHTTHATPGAADHADHDDDRDDEHHKHLHRLHLLASSGGDAHSDDGHGGACHHPHSSRAHDLEHVEHILIYISCAILCVFALENLLLIPCLGYEYFRQPLHILDGIVVAVSLYFEVSHIQGRMFEGGWVILIRLWRFVRIGHGTYEVTHHKELDELVEDLEGHREDIMEAIENLESRVLDRTDLSTEDKGEMLAEVAKAHPDFLFELIECSAKYMRAAHGHHDTGGSHKSPAEHQH